ncbi:hypothetical protein ACLOJK_024024, partial [Asimina triloba]
MEEEEFHMREPEAQSRASSTWSAEEVIFAKEGSRFYPFIGIARESALSLAPCRCSGNAPGHRLSHIVRLATVPNPLEDERTPGSFIDLSDSSEEAPLVGDGEAAPDRSPSHGFDQDPKEETPAVDVVEEAVVALKSLIQSISGRGSAGSVRKTLGVFEDAVTSCGSPIRSTGSRGDVFFTTGRVSATLISELVSVVPIAHSPGSFSNMSLPLPMISDLLFSGGGADDLNVDNVDWPLGLPGADALILFSSFFALASPRHAERSPSSVHRASSSGEG